MRRREAEQRGRRGETLAAWYLRLKGWRIVARRVKTPRGEVDLIARRGRTVAFVEVKWRRTEAELAVALDHWRLRRVIAAAEALASRFARPGDDLKDRRDPACAGALAAPHRQRLAWLKEIQA